MLPYQCGIGLDKKKKKEALYNLNKHTSTRFIQLPFAKPELGSVDGAGVELQPEHSVSVSSLGSPVVAFDLQREAKREEETHLKTHVE